MSPEQEFVKEVFVAPVKPMRLTRAEIFREFEQAVEWSVDDGYLPERTVLAMEQLTDEVCQAVVDGYAIVRQELGYGESDGDTESEWHSEHVTIPVLRLLYGDLYTRA